MLLFAIILFSGLFFYTFLQKQNVEAQSIPQGGLYKTLELVFQASTTPANPFNTYLLKIELTSPTGRVFTIDGFYDGDGNGGQTGNIWKARIAPDETGIWDWRTVPGDAPDAALNNLSGQFEVTASGDVGGLVANGKYFQLQTGKPIYLVGNFLDFTSTTYWRFTHVYMSENNNDTNRNWVISRHQDFHTANKINVYFANKGDYDGSYPTTPWVGNATTNDKAKMDLARWKKYDDYIRRFKDSTMFAEMWFFADNSNFGGLSPANKERLFRYAMARTSAFSHTLYVIALEYQEGWNEDEVMAAANYIQNHNPWNRLVSVHMLQQSIWPATFTTPPLNFIASQAGNGATDDLVNTYGRTMWNNEPIPHIDEEFGHLNSDDNAIMRNKLWANFASGAAGGGTGSDLKGLQQFISQSGIPFQTMSSNNGFISGGGSNRFALTQSNAQGHHYLIYSTDKNSINLTSSLSGSNLQGYWFNPNVDPATNPNPSPGTPFSVSTSQTSFTPPAKPSGETNPSSDWVLWITDSTNLIQNPVTHPSSGSTITQVQVNTSLPTVAPTATPTATPTPNLSITPSPTPTPGGSIFTDNLDVDSGLLDANDVPRYTMEYYRLAGGAKQYTDRTFSFTSVPTQLVNQTYIMTANDDKSWNSDPTPDDFLRFDLFENATVYVAHDDRLARPLWLSTFTDSGLDLVSGGGTFSLFQKEYSAGDTVRLGINGGGGSMYTVVIVPRLSGTPTPTLVPGDTNNDQQVDNIDVNNIITNFNSPTYVQGDFNQSGIVNILDLSILLSNFGN